MKLYVIVLTLIIVLVQTISVFWTDWIIKELFNKDINNWVILAGTLAVGLVLPRALNGILTLAYIAASFYILFIR